MSREAAGIGIWQASQVGKSCLSGRDDISQRPLLGGAKSLPSPPLRWAGVIALSTVGNG